MFFYLLMAEFTLQIISSDECIMCEKVWKVYKSAEKVVERKTYRKHELHSLAPVLGFRTKVFMTHLVVDKKCGLCFMLAD